MPQSQEPSAAAASEVDTEERRLKRDLGFWGLTAIGFSNIVGSGWLFAAMYAAQTAGPASLLAWLGAGVLCALVALVMVELGVSRPEGGGTVRWPLFASGRLVGTMIGWSTLLSVGGTAAEISAIMQYAGHYLPWVYRNGGLTGPGLAVALALSVVLTVVALFASGFHSGRLTASAQGGFAPYGYTAALSALAAGGIVYSLNGFQAPLDFSGEARNPRRTMPGSVLTGIGLALLLYLALQLAFLYTVPERLLGHGWSGVSFDSPFGQLALILNLQWVSSLLYVDAVVSPGGSAYVGVAIDARHTYALAKNGTLPRFFMRVSGHAGIPQRALLLNLAVIVVFLLPSSGWQQIVSVMGDMYLLIYAASAVAVAVFRGRPDGGLVGWIPGLAWIAPLSFVVASEFVYWSGWHDLRLALPMVLIGLPIFVVLRPEHHEEASLRAELRRGAWLVVYLLVLTLLSWLGSFKGSDRLPAPYDSITVAVVSLAVFAWAVHEGRNLPVLPKPRAETPV